MMSLKIGLLLLVVACVGYVVTQEAPESEQTKLAPTSGTTTADSTSTSPATSTVTDSTAVSTTAKPPPSISTGTTESGTSAQTSHVTHPTTEGSTTTQKPAELWAVKEGKNHTYCILLKATILIDFKYMNTKTNQTVTSTVNVVPSNSTANGSCGSERQSIAISFLSNWTLTLFYEQTHDKSYYYQSEVRLQWDLKTAHIADVPDIFGDNHNMEPMFNTSKKGYLCLARMKLYDNASVESGLLAIYTEQLKLEAFQEKSDTTFSDQYERCKEDTISNLVPIIVGACLGGLIIIVLIAYLIGRRRSRRGYESV